jgi:hypothetical protein
MTKVYEMQTEILFDNPDDMEAGKAELIRRGFKVKVLDWVDPEGGPYVWVMAYIDVDYADQGRFFDWLKGLRLGGDVIEAGHSIRTRRQRGALVETSEQAARAQAQIEDFARRADAVKRAVAALEDAFNQLDDWPYNLGKVLSELKQSASSAAYITCEWATLSNADFDPSELVTG